MKRVKYLCGDFVEYLKTSPEQFDLIVSSGVLYHMRNPVELIALLASHTNRIFMWTHYYEDSRIKSDLNLRHKFPSRSLVEVQGFSHTLYRQEYQVSLNVAGFCGGSENYSSWLTRTDLLNALSHFGFKDVRIEHEQLDHPHGPCFSLVATK
jgi:hypothetical protein